MQKKIALLIVGLICLFFAFGCSNSQNQEVTFISGNYTYALTNGKVKIVKYSGEETDLVIPESIDGHPVVAIADEAFSRCDSLISVSIPNSVIDIGINPFAACFKLQQIIVPSTHPTLSIIDGALFSTGKEKRMICLPYGSKNTSFSIPEGTVAIGDKAFYSCSSVTTVIIPDSVISIGNYAFMGCNSLSSITLPNSVTSIGDNPFNGCNKLKSITISPDNPNYYIDNNMLISKKDMRLICYFEDRKVTELTIPQGVKIIGDRAFYGCSKLTTVIIPDSVTSIGERAFSSCTELTSVNIPEGVKSIEEEAFAFCTSLYKVTLPNSLTSIGDNAFLDCYCLTSITIPDGVTNIGVNPFCLCLGLKNINVSPDSTALSVIDGVLYSKKDKRLIFMPCRLQMREFSIPNGVKTIDAYAFYYCTSLTSVTIPDSVTSINEYAFSGCSSLRSISIPKSVTDIGTYAFMSCSSLRSVTITKNTTFIGENAFLLCHDSLVLTVEKDSYAANYAKENSIRYTYPDANDWL